MKFAVIEYETKTNKIWRHRDEHPNYLCNPQTEIDPTSYGCYASALCGEYIPLKGLIMGSLEKPPSFFQEAKFRLQKKQVIKSNYSLDYLKKFDVILVLSHITENAAMASFAEYFKKIFPEKILLCSSPYPFGRLREAWREKTWYKNYLRLIDACDIFINVHRQANDYQQLMTKTPVVYIPQPYPYEFAKNFFKKRGKKEKIIFCAGDTNRPDNLGSQVAAKEIQKKNPQYKILVTEMPGFNTEPLKNTNFKTVPFYPWREQLEKLSNYYMVINLDTWFTRGRVQVDCAACGTPSLGINADGQIELYPDLTCADAKDIKKIISLGNRLIADGQFYDEIQNKAIKRLAEYSYKKTAERIRNLIQLLKENRIKEFKEQNWQNQ